MLQIQNLVIDGDNIDGSLVSLEFMIACSSADGAVLRISHRGFKAKEAVRGKLKDDIARGRIRLMLPGRELKSGGPHLRMLTEICPEVGNDAAMDKGSDSFTYVLV